MSVEFGPRGNQAPTSRTESSDISLESLRIPRFYSRLARRPLPPIIDKMERQSRFLADRVADAHPVINPERTSRRRRAIRELRARLERRPMSTDPVQNLDQILRRKKPTLRSVRELPKTKAIELERDHDLEPDHTVSAGHNEFEGSVGPNVFIAPQDIWKIREMVGAIPRLELNEPDTATEDLNVIELLYEEQALHESALSTEEPNTLELSLRGQVIEYVEKPQAE